MQAIALAHLLAGAMPGAHPGNRSAWFALLGGGFAVRGLAALAGELVAGLGASAAKADLRHHLVLAAVTGRAPAPAGEIAAMAGRGLDALDIYLGRCLPDFVLAAGAPLALLAVAGVLDWPSMVVMAVVVALFPIFGALVGQATMPLARERWDRVRDMGRHVADIFQGLPTMRAFGRSALEREKLARLDRAMRRSSSRALRVAFLSGLVLDTLGSVSVALVAVPLGLRLLVGSVRLAPALAVLVLAPEIFLPLRRASAEFHESAEGLAAAARVMAVLGAAGEGRVGAARGRPVGAPAPSPGPPDPSRTAVELRSASIVVADREQPVLDRVDLIISPGEKVLLVGPSGAGKTSVLSLLLGFLTPSSGQVTVGGEDLFSLDLERWRRLVTYLPEQPTLLAGTLADNLRLADPGASDEHLRSALIEAGAGELARTLPGGIQARVGEGGRLLSAGESQSVALARVLLRPASLYLLDEPTVHLGPAGAEQALASLEKAMSGKSALIVTHDPAAQRLADRVVALCNGRLAQREVARA
jgi:ATP-binding cassette subfamily C protein CydD